MRRKVSWLLVLLAIIPAGCNSGPSREKLMAQYNRLAEQLTGAQELFQKSRNLQIQLEETARLAPSRLENESLVEQLQQPAKPCSVSVVEVKVVDIKDRKQVVTRTTQVTLGASAFDAALCQLDRILHFDTLTSLDSMDCTRADTGVLTCQLRVKDWWFPPPGPAMDVKALHVRLGVPDDTRVLEKEIRRWKTEVDSAVSVARTYHSRIEEMIEARRSYEKQKASGEELLAFLRKITASDIALDRLWIHPEGVSLDGAVATSEDLEILDSMPLPDDLELKISGIRVDPRLVPVEPQDLEALRTTPLAEKATKIKLHALQAEGQWLRALLFRGQVPFMIRTKRDLRVTGRFEATSQKEAHEILIGAVADLGTSPIKPGFLRGRGRKVTLSFVEANPFYIFGLLGEVLRLNIVVPPGLDRTTIQVSNLPADTVVTNLAETLDLQLQRYSARLVLLLPKGSPRYSVPTGPMRPRVEVILDGITASQAMALLGSAGPIRVAVPCEGGKPVQMQLRNATLHEAQVAVLAQAGLPFRPGPIKNTGCAIPIWNQSVVPDPDRYQMAGLVISGAKGAALLRDSDGNLSLLGNGYTGADGTEVRISRNGIHVTREDSPPLLIEMAELVAPGTSRAVTAFGTLPRHLDGLRLAATIVRPQRGSALLESPGGDHYLIHSGWDRNDPGRQFEIEPGKLTVEESWRDPLGQERISRRVFRLRRRAIDSQ
jgi:hypothetical protein